METFTPAQIIALSIVLVIGIPLCIGSFFVIRRLIELHNTRDVIEGELFVSDDGAIYSQFSISVEQLTERDLILLKIHHVKGGNHHGNIPTETHET